MKSKLAPASQINNHRCISRSAATKATVIALLVLAVVGAIIGGFCLQGIMPGVGAASAATLGITLCIGSGSIIVSLIPVTKRLQYSQGNLNSKATQKTPFENELELGIEKAIEQDLSVDQIEYELLANQLKEAYQQNKQKLTLSWAHSATLPPFISVLKHFEHLTKLKIESDTLVELPLVIFDLLNLEMLDVCLCPKLQKLPSAISKLTKLKEFRGNCTSITELPAEICTLPALKRLTMQAGQLNTLPPELQVLIDKQCELILKNNPITELPEVLAIDKNLEWLCLNLMPCTVVESSQVLDINDTQELDKVKMSIALTPCTPYLESLAKRFQALISQADYQGNYTHIEINPVKKQRST